MSFQNAKNLKDLKEQIHLLHYVYCKKIGNFTYFLPF